MTDLPKPIYADIVCTITIDNKSIPIFIQFIDGEGNYGLKISTMQWKNFEEVLGEKLW